MLTLENYGFFRRQGASETNFFIKESYYLLQGTKVCQGIPNGARLKEKREQ
jgi:hypothetical protein